MADIRIGKRYAQALFETAVKYDVVSAVEEDLAAIVNLLHTDEQFRHFVMSPQVAREEKVGIFERLFSDRVTALTMQALRVLLDKRREEEVEAIYEEYVTLRRTHYQVVFATVTSAEALDEDQKNSIVRRVESQLAKKVEANFEIDPHLLGGVRVAYDNFVLDGSIRGELRRLREHLLYDVLKQS